MDKGALFALGGGEIDGFAVGSLLPSFDRVGWIRAWIVNEFRLAGGDEEERCECRRAKQERHAEPAGHRFGLLGFHPEGEVGNLVVHGMQSKE